ncbi:hypothetical protein [Brevibacillus sp. BC25]|uniref:hypothetical protein n=1 Tax=Brevibacillus sp. BC25 TaxID=1144308 RepID=UPI000270E574|nr:hypothetical protein [Brevibacillus sp. BC25]EJL29094.1 hypothetical protein PMI05_01878 [Brevibacillus sp. BC25]
MPFLNYIILNAFLFISKWGDDLIRRLRRRNSTSLIVFVNLLYCAVLSLGLGFFTMLLVLVAMEHLKMSTINLNPYYGILLPVSGYVFICFGAFLLLNIDRIFSFSIPRILMLTFISILILQPIRQLWRSLLFVFITAFFLTLVLFPMVISIGIPDQMIGKVFWTIAPISFLIVVIIFNEGTISTLSRASRQLALYLLLFSGFLYLNIYQLLLYENGTWDEQTVISAGLLIIGLVFVLATVLDKARTLFNEVGATHRRTIRRVWRELSSTYSLTDCLRVFENYRLEFVQGIEETRRLWRIGERRRVIGAIAIPLLMISIVSIMFTGMKAIQGYADYLKNQLILQWYAVFNGNKELAENIFLLLLGVIGLFWVISRLLLRFSSINWNERLRLFSLILILILFVSILISFLVPWLATFLIYYIVKPVFCLLVLLMVLLRFIR